MRKLAAMLAAAVAALAIAVNPALAQQPETTVKVNAKVSPKKAGTKKDPQGVTFSGSVKWTTLTPGVEPPIITGATVFFSKDGEYNGGKYPKCSKRTLELRQTAGCPKKSIMGSATGIAKADNVTTRPKIEFVNGGKNMLWFFTTLFNPAFVQEPVPGVIKKISHPKWGYRMRITVPESLQVVAGVPIALTDFNYKVGGKPYARDFITTTGCPKGNAHPFQVTTYYLYNDGSTSQSTFSDKVPCTR
jgi:hypothetical protein